MDAGGNMALMRQLRILLVISVLVLVSYGCNGADEHQAALNFGSAQNVGHDEVLHCIKDCTVRAGTDAKGPLSNMTVAEGSEYFVARYIDEDTAEVATESGYAEADFNISGLQPGASGLYLRKRLRFPDDSGWLRIDGFNAEEAQEIENIVVNAMPAALFDQAVVTDVIYTGRDGYVEGGALVGGLYRVVREGQDEVRTVNFFTTFRDFPELRSYWAIHEFAHGYSQKYGEIRIGPNDYNGKDENGKPRFGPVTGQGANIGVTETRYIGEAFAQGVDRKYERCFPCIVTPFAKSANMTYQGADLCYARRSAQTALSAERPWGYPERTLVQFDEDFAETVVALSGHFPTQMPTLDGMQSAQLEWLSPTGAYCIPSARQAWYDRHIAVR